MKKRYKFIYLFLLVLVAGYWLFPRDSSSRKVYDCFLFFNEFELLKIRLEEMAPYVDHFVIVESNETFRGDAKPLNFQEYTDLFEKFKEKIIHKKIQKLAAGA